MDESELSYEQLKALCNKYFNSTFPWESIFVKEPTEMEKLAKLLFWHAISKETGGNAPAIPQDLAALLK